MNKKTAFITAVATGLLCAVPALAAPDLGMEYAETIGLPDLDVRLIVAGVIRALLGLLGLYLIIRIMEGGFLYMTHGGNEEKRTEAIGVIKGAVIGMLIIGMSASMANFVVDAVMKATGAYSQTFF
jgi:hypothetical protein